MKIVGRDQRPPASWTKYIFEQGQRPKSPAVPTNDGLRPDNRYRREDRGNPSIEPNQQGSIDIVQLRSPRRLPAQHIDLLAQDQNFRLKPGSRLKERSHDAQNQLKQIDHQGASLPRPFPASIRNRIFGTHRVCVASYVFFAKSELSVFGHSYIGRIPCSSGFSADHAIDSATEKTRPFGF
jgi:hypothetical protein